MKDKSPIDELFFELYGYYPNKPGQAYELIVAAAFKAITGSQVSYDKHERGLYSQTDYQVDAIVPNEYGENMVEAKDYTLDDRKVGRSDLQKLQGALTDLDFEKGIFASATEYTKPAKKYSDATEQNPMQKVIDLYHIRPSTETDEEGRIKKFVINMIVVTPDYDKGQFKYAWTKDAIETFEKNGFIGKQMTMVLDRFYKKSGEIDCLLMDFTRNNQPIQTNIDDEYGQGCWLLHDKYIKIEDVLYGLKGIEYKIPFSKGTSTFTIESDGVPKILIKSEDGKIDKLLTDEELRKITFGDDKTL
jgi:Restriction endonuclease.